MSISVFIKHLKHQMVSILSAHFNIKRCINKTGQFYLHKFINYIIENIIASSVTVCILAELSTCVAEGTCDLIATYLFRPVFYIG